MRINLLTTLLASSLACQAVFAQSLGGVYSANENGREFLWEVRDNSEEGGPVSLTNIFGEGFSGSRNGNQVVLDGGGTASISQGGDIDLQADGRSIMLRRIATTDSSFPLTREEAYRTPVYLNGDWDIEEILLDQITGETLPQFDGSLVYIDVFSLFHVAPNSLRFVDSLNTYFQGVPLNGQDFIFRIIENPNATPLPGFETVAGSQNNFPRDVLGQGYFRDINHFEVDLVLQTYSRQFPDQFVLNIIGTRKDPFLNGDVDLDSDKDAQDFADLTNLLGVNKHLEEYRLTADLDGNGAIEFADLGLFDNQSVSAMAAGPWMTGMWFDPARSGEGFHVFVLDSERAVVTWFSYGPSGGQAWFIGIGAIEGNSIVVDESEITGGTVFGEGFNAQDVVRENWGSLRISYEGCAAASVTFFSNQVGFGNGGYRLERLSTPKGVDCQSMNTTGADSGRFTGAWFDSSRSGEGWFFEELPDERVLVTWYTYDLAGNQMWLLGVGSVVDGAVEVPEMLLVSGGVFGPDFDVDNISEDPWGSLRFDKSGCASGQVRYEALDPEFGAATREVVLLAGVSGLGC